MFFTTKTKPEKVKMIGQDVLILISIFCNIEDFCKQFEPEWKKILIEQQKQLIGKSNQRNRPSKLSLSEAMTIVVMFHKTGYRTFKDYYLRQVIPFMKNFFPNVLSYNKFINLMKTCLFPLFVYSQACSGNCTGISFVDSTILTVCHPRRIHSHRIF